MAQDLLRTLLLNHCFITHPHVLVLNSLQLFSCLQLSAKHCHAWPRQHLDLLDHHDHNGPLAAVRHFETSVTQRCRCSDPRLRPIQRSIPHAITHQKSGWFSTATLADPCSVVAQCKLTRHRGKWLEIRVRGPRHRTVSVRLVPQHSLVRVSLQVLMCLRCRMCVRLSVSASAGTDAWNVFPCTCCTVARVAYDNRACACRCRSTPGRPGTARRVTDREKERQRQCLRTSRSSDPTVPEAFQAENPTQDTNDTRHRRSKPALIA